MLKRYAVVENDIATNVIEFEEAQELPIMDGQTFVQTDEAQIGWQYHDGGFIAPKIEPQPPMTPQQQINVLEVSISQRRIREAVLGVDGGWLKNINDKITALREQIKSVG